ncbi:MAG: hypothetical protein AEth_01868 [Candidatus Argoarchaeum ethanivorans]|uniref:Uncharacterized protein n=1 Tax=Candidatus Argoarchaeum ethanivorans TaxID=2608793 RepID=A0A8B3RZW4_9EURY|nr:MAG: hypothetical protein AEth_01868 [Candidatus Argoarchaeum ethanivorans]
MKCTRPISKKLAVLRTSFSAGVLAVLLVLACAGTAAGATTWVVDDSGGADFVSIHAEAADRYRVQNGLYTIITPRPLYRGQT